MSGGFFRGTSADQDTRFSNKQAKLLKSQKFAPELEHLVDMKKVKMDVMRPWIANRVTELLGFEDEVLINFIYGLLDAKEVNGKEIQISLTGFMEKNTGKFMKELWTLLLSAQNNESGVPQQFLDAKEEETRKKQAEMDRITNEIQRKKEKESKELERDRVKKMDGGAETKATGDALESAPKGSSGYKEDEKAAGNRNGTRGRNSDNKSRSLSRSPEARKRAISPNKLHHSPRRSVTPRRKYSSRDSRSPTRRISSHSRKRSRSPSLRRSPSPVRRRRPSPIHRRLPSPIRRRSPSPVRRRRSPLRRSPSPVRRRRSPPRRSPSPVRRCMSRSPVHCLSPSTMRHRRSPSPTQYRRSPSPIPRRRSPSPIQRQRPPSPNRRRRSPSPLRRRRSPSPMSSRSPSPIQRGRPPVPIRRRSPSPMRRRSPNPRHRTPSPVRSRYRRSPSTSLDDSTSLRHKSPLPAQRRLPNASRPRSTSPRGSSSPSPVRHRIHSAVRRSSKERIMSPAESPDQRVSAQEKSFAVPRRSASSLRSPQRVSKALSPSPSHSSKDRRSNSPHESHVRGGRRNRSGSSSRSPTRRRQGHITNDDSSSPPLKPKQQKPFQRTPESGQEDEDSDYARDYKARSSQKGPVDSSIINMQKDSLAKVRSKEEHSERVPGHQATDSRSRLDIVESRRRDQQIMSEKGDQKRPLSDEKDRLRSNNVNENNALHKLEIKQIVVEKADQSNGDGAFDSATEGSGKRRTDNKEKRRHKRSHREGNASDNNSHDSEIEEKKEAKRRRKEEKKQKKEGKRKRREERRRRREERRAEKLKKKGPSGSCSSDDEHSGKRESHPSDSEDTQSEQKKLEIELRKKAIESLKAKKGISH